LTSHVFQTRQAFFGSNKSKIIPNKPDFERASEANSTTGPISPPPAFAVQWQASTSFHNFRLECIGAGAQTHTRICTGSQ
jgi:hypothetical protein